MRIWNPLKRYRIDKVLFCSFAGIVVLFLVLFGWSSYRISSDELIKNTSLYQMRLLHELTNRMGSYLLSIEQSSVALTRNFNQSYSEMPFASSAYARDRLRIDAISEIEHFVNSNGSVDSVHIYIEDPLFYDEMLHVYFYDKSQLLEQSWYAGIKYADAGWLPARLIRSARSEVEVISFARNIYNYAGNPYGLLLVNVKVDYITSMIQGDGGAQRLLIDSGGRMVTSVGSFPFDINEMINELKLDSSMETFYKMVKTNWMKQNELFVWSKMLNTNWVLYEVTPWHEITTSGAEIAKTLIIMGIISLVLVLITALAISRQFVNPIKMLLKKMSAFPFDKRGQAVNLPIDYKNEFGLLFQGFSKLMHRIDELYASLDKQHEQKREAEIRALQVMINPHFLYNSLDQINWMAIDKGQKDISEMLSLLANMYRVGLSNGSVFVQLKDELYYVEGYLKFQKVHWEHRLVYRITLEEELGHYYIPRLSLQPFVENCFIHGFHKRKQGSITIEGKIKDDRLEIRIADDGRGLKSSTSSESNKKLGGYGIFNVQERYRALFGEGFGYELIPREGGGTIAIIRLPIIMDQEGRMSNVEIVNR